MPPNYRSHEFHEKKLPCKRCSSKNKFTICQDLQNPHTPPHPIHHSGTTLCMYYRIYFYNIHQKEEKHYSQKTELSSH